MILLAHIVLALSGLAYSTYIFFKPSQRGIKLTSGLAVLTLLTGTYLVASTGSHLLSACLSGLFYLGAVSVGIVTAHLKLATAKNKINK